MGPVQFSVGVQKREEVEVSSSKDLGFGDSRRKEECTCGTLKMAYMFRECPFSLPIARLIGSQKSAKRRAAQGVLRSPSSSRREVNLFGFRLRDYRRVGSRLGVGVRFSP